MVRAPVPALPNATDPFILDTDASDRSVGNHVIYFRVKTGPIRLGPSTVGPPPREAGTRLRWESVKGVQVVQEAEGINLQDPGEEEIKDQQRVDLELAWVARWRETGEEPTEREVFMGPSAS
jgi:hypothetical protein